MSDQIILIDDNTANNVLNEDLFRGWNQNADIRIIDNSSEVLRFFNREFSGQETTHVKISVFLDEFIPYMEGMELIEYVERMNIQNTAGIDVYFLSNNQNDVLLLKTERMRKIIKEVIPKPLTKSLISQLLGA